MYWHCLVPLTAQFSGRSPKLARNIGSAAPANIRMRSDPARNMGFLSSK